VRQDPTFDGGDDRGGDNDDRHDNDGGGHDR